MTDATVESAENRIVIDAPWQQVFQRAADVERWPEFLPHYRWVRALEGRDDGRIVEMAARRGGWPVQWTALLQVRPDERRIYFLHLKGPARGMRVYWELSESMGQTSVVIHHDLSLKSFWLRSKPGRWIVAAGFIGPIASRTLSCFKQVIEGER